MDPKAFSPQKDPDEPSPLHIRKQIKSSTAQSSPPTSQYSSSDMSSPSASTEALLEQTTLNVSRTRPSVSLWSRLRQSSKEGSGFGRRSSTMRRLSQNLTNALATTRAEAHSVVEGESLLSIPEALPTQIQSHITPRAVTPIVGEDILALPAHMSEGLYNTEIQSDNTTPAMRPIGEGELQSSSGPASTRIMSIVVGPEITITPQTTTVALDKDWISMYASVVIKGALVRQSEPIEHPTNATSLHIAVVLDTSVFVSPAAFGASRNLAMTIASSLDPDQDQFALLFMTSDATPKPMSSKSLPPLPLGNIDLGRLSSTLNALDKCTEPPANDYLSSLVRDAEIELRRSSEVDSGSVCRHIIILTPRVDAVPSSTSGTHKAAVHVICPGSVSWKSNKPAHGTGWLLQSQPEVETIQDLVSQLRQGRPNGSVKDLQLVLKAATHCRISEIIGSLTFPSLHLGQLITTVVKIEIAAEDIRKKLTTKDLMEVTQNGPTAESDFLARVPLPVLQAKLKFKHSSLGDDVVCSKARTVRVEFFDPSHRLSVPAGIAPETLQVHRSLTSVLATNDDPAPALERFTTFFGKEGERCADRAHWAMVFKELKYQAEVCGKSRSDAGSSGEEKGPALQAQDTNVLRRSTGGLVAAGPAEGVENRRSSGMFVLQG
ncbi:hypothetical protein MMC13_006136 [Lambiella insularis]|nr:hypothetical protein [Lambiella insularis]